MNFETCAKCGERIRFIRMGNSARWSSENGNSCDHTPYVPGRERDTPDMVWDRYTMKYVHVK